MADFTIISVTRTVVLIKGEIVDQQELNEVFDEACDGRLASMSISYDKVNDLTRILLTPCRITEEFVSDEDGKDVNVCTVYEVDKSIMKSIQKRFGGTNAFADRVWKPYMKAQAQDNITLDEYKECSDCYTFKLRSSDTRKGTKVATTSFRNRNMMSAKFFITEFLAPFAEKARPSKPAARLLTELSMKVSEAACDCEKIIAPILPN